MIETKNQPIHEPITLVDAPRLISASDVRKMIGNVSDMTIWRWLKDEKLSFPKPIYVQRRRFWRESELLSWINNRQSELPE